MFYSHPVDPRLVTTLLPSGIQLTLSRSYNSPNTEAWPYLQRPDVYVMTSRDSEQYSRKQITFDNDGFIKEINFIDKATDAHFNLVFKRNRVDKCKVSAIWTTGSSGEKTETSVNVCDNQPKPQADQALSSKTKKRLGVKGSPTNRHNRKTRHNSQRGHGSHKVNMLEMPVNTERCGYDTELTDPFVFVKFTPTSNTNSIRTNSLSVLHQLEHSIVILSERIFNGKYVVRIPDVNHPLEAAAIKSKCKETIFKHNSICSESHLQSYTSICVRLTEVLSNNDLRPLSTNSSSNQYSSYCAQFIHMLNVFCDSSKAKVFSEDRTCRSQYSTSVNIFSSEYFKMIPYAVYPDGKTVSGREQRLNLRDAAEILNNGFTIKDNKPDFKITKITVIPNDPVPHDIYQVKMEYNCATNATVMKMEVTGSDKYRNHVTCHGSHPIGSCTLHAAGAQNAVVDNVTIEVSDKNTGFNMTEKMVVIF